MKPYIIYKTYFISMSHEKMLQICKGDDVAMELVGVPTLLERLHKVRGIEDVGYEPMAAELGLCYKVLVHDRGKIKINQERVHEKVILALTRHREATQRYIS